MSDGAVAPQPLQSRHNKAVMMTVMAWKTVIHPDAEEELNRLPHREATAVINALDKLRELGPNLPFPHSSNVQGADDLRELRPRAGHSPWRAFYRLVGTTYVVAAIGPDAKQKRKAFNRAVSAAEQRLKDLEED